MLSVCVGLTPLFNASFDRAFVLFCFVLLGVHLLQVKEIEKGQEGGLGLDVKFEVLPVRSVAM